MPNRTVLTGTMQKCQLHVLNCLATGFCYARLDRAANSTTIAKVICATIFRVSVLHVFENRFLSVNLIIIVRVALCIHLNPSLHRIHMHKISFAKY